MPKESSTLKKKPLTAKKKTVATKVKRKKVSAIPKGYHSITPYLAIDNNAADAINFYKKVFGAKEIKKMEFSDGKIAHAELKIGDAKIMLADECLGMDFRGPQNYGGSPVRIHLYIKDVDTVAKAAVKHGAKIQKPVEDMFYGDRSCAILDPYGHKWFISTHIEDVTPAKMRKRAAELFNK
ncbi:MAG TPA: VOC family protein [Gammaproteobacteria bacterium]|nr:VOC family protein [Gammaproteobacteria bacterium]